MLRQYAIFLIVLTPLLGFAQADWTKITDISPSMGGVADAAISQDGHIVLVTRKGAGQTTVSGSFYGVEYRQADYYAAHAENLTGGFSTPIKLSDSNFYNNEADLIMGAGGEYWIAWNSGDALAGFRLHTAHSVDGGQTYTTTTKSQGLTDNIQGALAPRLAKTGNNLLIASTGYLQDMSYRPGRAYVKTLPNGEHDFPLTHVSHLDLTSQSETTICASAPIVSPTGSVIIPLTHTYTTFTNRFYRDLFILKSSDSGQTWSQDDIPTTMSLGLHPTFAVSPSGDWLFVTTEQQTLNSGSVYLTIRMSIDNGLTWNLKTTFFDSANYDVPRFLRTDGNGRWLLYTRDGYYTHSDDDGETWAPMVKILNWPDSMMIITLEYIGNGKWASVQFRSESGNITTGIYTMQWGDSIVDEWSLY